MNCVCTTSFPGKFVFFRYEDGEAKSARLSVFILKRDEMPFGRGWFQLTTRADNKRRKSKDCYFCLYPLPCLSKLDPNYYRPREVNPLTTSYPGHFFFSRQEDCETFRLVRPRIEKRQTVLVTRLIILIFNAESQFKAVNNPVPKWYRIVQSVEQIVTWGIKGLVHRNKKILTDRIINSYLPDAKGM